MFQNYEAHGFLSMQVSRDWLAHVNNQYNLRKLWNVLYSSIHIWIVEASGQFFSMLYINMCLYVSKDI